MCSYLQMFVPQIEVRIFPSVMALFFKSLKKYSLFLAEVFNIYYFHIT